MVGRFNTTLMVAFRVLTFNMLTHLALIVVIYLTVDIPGFLNRVALPLYYKTQMSRF